MNTSTYSWTPSQQRSLDALGTFLQNDARAFVLTGAAGTGKSTLMQQLVRQAAGSYAVHLVAPTGRAARILAQRAARPARTVHSHLYLAEPLPDRPGVRLTPKGNRDTSPTLLVVDEASMVSSRPPSGDEFVVGRPLLDDILAHVAAGPEGSKVVFVGDACQLPPVLEQRSLALEPQVLQSRYRNEAASAALTDVVRHASSSPVLQAAHGLRRAIEGAKRAPALPFTRLRGQDAAARAYLDHTVVKGVDAAVLLAYANTTVHRLNQLVRARRGLSGTLAAGDVVVADRDGVMLDEQGQRRSTVRGGALEVVAVLPLMIERAGLRFQEVQLRPVEVDAPLLHGLMLVDYLTAVRPGIGHDAERNLYADRVARNETFRETRANRDDQFMSAARLRYGYAMTVHKAQGGEWNHVLLNDWMPPSLLGTPEAYRWLYTAITRSREVVTLF